MTPLNDEHVVPQTWPVTEIEEARIEFIHDNWARNASESAEINESQKSDSWVDIESAAIRAEDTDKPRLITAELSIDTDPITVKDD
jgi:hypothetical protein